MSDIENMQLFENQPVRTAWNEEEEEWYFSVVDVIGVLTDQPDSRRAAKYWSVLKIRIKRESSELTTICSQLKLKSSDGKLLKRRSLLSCGLHRSAERELKKLWIRN